MDTPQANAPQRPQLKKVKRPINRMPQMAPAMPAAAPQNQSTPNKPQINANPFAQADLHTEPNRQPKNLPDVGDEAFNLDAYLDEGPLPSTNVNERTNSNPQFLQDDDLQPEYSAESANLPPYLTKNVLILLGIVLFFVGLLTAKVFWNDSKIVRNGLQGVVVNPEVPKGRARCGVAERTQGCVLYIMNPQRQELNARDFYDLASQMTGRQRFVIETGNMRYANTKIRPGDIAQLNIPPL